MSEHALARKEILIDFFFPLIWSTREVFLGGSLVKVAAHYLEMKRAKSVMPMASVQT